MPDELFVIYEVGKILNQYAGAFYKATAGLALLIETFRKVRGYIKNKRKKQAI